tara:strand:- start:97 stop:336 length:240 start_codon:yes stop_codon:yes gene_type:complete
LSNNLEKSVFEVLIEVFPSLNGQIDYDWGPNNIKEWDSLNHLNLIMSLNEKFSIELEFEDVLSIETVGDIFSILKKKGL